MWSIIEKINTFKKENKSFALVTVTHTLGSSPREVGAKMIVSANGLEAGTIGGGKLELLAIEAAQNAITQGQSQNVSYPLCQKSEQCCGGQVEIFIDVILKRPELFIFGAGHVGQAICKTLEDTDFAVSAIDEREEWINSSGLPASTQRLKLSPLEWVESHQWDEKYSHALVMTHSHTLDEEIVSLLLKKQLRFIGLIGSKTKWRRIKSQLIERGHTEKELSKVTCPIGSIALGKSPKEIAISFAAQVLKYNHDERHLTRSRRINAHNNAKTSLHHRTEVLA